MSKKKIISKITNFHPALGAEKGYSYLKDNKWSWLLETMNRASTNDLLDFALGLTETNQKIKCKHDIAFLKSFVPKHLIEFNEDEEELDPTMYLTGSKKGDLAIHKKLMEMFKEYKLD